MILYKYLSDERIDILKNGLIRFTQPSCFNDPYEALPNVEQVLSSELADTLFRAMLYKDFFDKFIEKQQNKEVIERFHKIRASWTTMSKEDLKNVYARLTIGEKDENLSSEMKSFWNQQVGILSLTERFNDLTMWSHYANNHKGFVIGFNKQVNITEKCMIRPRKVIYSPVRPKLNLLDLDEDWGKLNLKWVIPFLLTKSQDWINENEWRQVNNLSYRDEIKTKREEDIYLFRYNRDSINQIYLGCEMKPKIKKEIVNIVNDWNIEIFEMKLNPKSYKLDEIQIK